MVSYVGGEFGPSKSPLAAFAERGGVLIAEAGSGGEGGSPGGGGEGGGLGEGGGFASGLFGEGGRP